ncbi:SRPBCC family protein [Aquimarina sp. MMG016]|uniref:SRPBCC family protein n=1 Tax=Aquimarina sp. MMG016 TaxID=2822690 RepID=UPI001B3A2643|nr:SRPBCC family protein [Aquimarina sp. MMG016]MBQ4822107.1 SRPBCC family protein [Aquimarina sp. MMG016]
MKYQGSVIIDRSREIVTALFMNSDYNKEYQDGFIKKELISGVAGQNGAKSKMYYKYGKRDMILTEIITKNNLPDSFEASYYHKHMDNTMKCTFIQISENQTRYEYEYEYIRMNWVLPKLMAILFPSIYRKQGEKWMQQFKTFVEKQ